MLTISQSVKKFPNKGRLIQNLLVKIVKRLLMFGAAQGCTGLHRAAQDCTGFHRAAQVCTGLHRVAQGCSGLRRAVLSC